MADVHHQFGIGVDAQRSARLVAVARMENRRVAAVGNRADARRVGVVVACRDPAQILAHHQDALCGVQHGPGQAPTDGIAHAQVRAARADHQRQPRAPRRVHRAERIRVQPVREHHVGRELAQRRVQGARAEPAVERPGQQRERGVFDIAHIAVRYRMRGIGGAE